MKAGIAGLVAAVLLAGCRSQSDASDDFPDISMPSGKPEVTIYNTDLATVKITVPILQRWRPRF